LSVQTTPHPQIAVVGAGPAGFYATQHIIKALPHAQVDIYEKLPVPFGLVRYGVAPDHPEVKNCITTFTKTAQSQNVNFFGNISLGKEISLNDLMENYNAVLLSYGVEEDKLLGVEGETLTNILAARDVVNLYNGFPGYKDLQINLDTETVMIVGVGNVSLDVARMILSPVDVLKKTDVTESWLEQLARSKVKRVVLVGRRGPLEVSFTIKELRELVKLQNARPVMNKVDYDGVREKLNSLERPRKRLTDLLVKTALDVPDVKTQEKWDKANLEWELKLYRSPLRFLAGSDKKTVGSAVLGINVADGKGSVVATGDEEVVDCGLVIRSVGYKSIRVDPSLPFDPRRGVVPNEAGRVRELPGLYTAGWLGTGPRGVIIDTMNTAFKVGAVIVEDLMKGKLEIKSGSSELKYKLGNSTSWTDWESIDKEECRRGDVSGKPREKFFLVEDMLNTLK